MSLLVKMRIWLSYNLVITFFLREMCYFSMKFQSLGTSRAGDSKELIILKLPILVWRTHVLIRKI